MSNSEVIFECVVVGSDTECIFVEAYDVADSSVEYQEIRREKFRDLSPKSLTKGDVFYWMINGENYTMKIRSDELVNRLLKMRKHP